MTETGGHLPRDETGSALANRLDGGAVDLLLTLGSGLSDVADAIENPVDIPVSEIPGLPASTVPGHRSLLRHGELAGTSVLAQLGRAHLYEGHEPADVVAVVRAAAALGCRRYLVTNAAGGLDQSWTPGDLMLITDHLNLTGVSPLTGVLRDGGPPFVDMADAYDPELRAVALEAADGLDLTLRQGVYAGLQGPAYETPAEVAMLRTLGADAVGMSTVLEVIEARSHGMQVLGFSSITNVHGEGVATSHEEVLDVGAQAAERLARLVLEVLSEL